MLTIIQVIQVAAQDHNAVAAQRDAVIGGRHITGTKFQTGNGRRR